MGGILQKAPLYSVAVIFSSFLALLFLAAPTPNPVSTAQLERELTRLDERGSSYRMLPGNQLEVTDCVSGQRWVFDVDRALTPRQPTYLPDRKAGTGLPTLTIDLRTIDTNLYNWRYRHVGSMPLSGEWGFPLQVGDLNRNGVPEAYGVYQTQAIYVSRAYEQDAGGSWLLKHQYPENSGLADMQADIDQNGLMEVYLRYGDSMFVYEQVSPDSLPKTVKFRHRQWYYSATGIPNQINWMTGSPLPEIIYRGSEPDTNGPPTTNIEKDYVVRFDPTLNNLKRIWSVQIPLGCQAEGCPWAIATGDFDDDGKKEFVTSNVAGNVFLVEHTTGDSFTVTWSTSLSVAGRAASGDVDGNGLTEFFVGGTQLEGDGYVHLRAYAFERTDDNTYQPVFQFNIFPTGIFFVDLYQTADVDGDDIPEFLISTAGGILVIKALGVHNYELFYYQPSVSLDGVAAWKINDNRAAHLFVSRHLHGQPIVKRTDVYQLDSSLVLDVKDRSESPSTARLLQNYPNPFNSQTTIAYELAQRGRVKLQVFDITGKEVIMVVDQVQEAGRYVTHWEPDSKRSASGTYLLRLTFNGDIQTKKVIYLK
jgi:hypothetical protein